MDNRLLLLCGQDIPIPELQLVIHQPKINEISLIGEKNFFTGVQCLCIKKNMISQDKSVLDNINNFQIFMRIMTDNETKDKRLATQALLTLLFPSYNVSFTPQSLLLMHEKQIITIDANNFEMLQDVFDLIFCVNTGPMDQQSFNPVDKQAKAIADKLMRARQRLAEEQGAENISVFSQYVSALTVGLQSMSLQSLLDLTMYQLYDLMERYSLYVAWDIDVRTRLAGGDPKSKPDNWMKNIH